jgi:hypothetical protein
LLNSGRVGSKPLAIFIGIFEGYCHKKFG